MNANPVSLRMAAVALALHVMMFTATWTQTRPHDPFVEKMITPDRSRQLKVALNANLWVMYDLPLCQLYQAWAGGTAGGSLQDITGLFFDQNPHFADWFVVSGAEYFKESVGEYFASWTKPADIDLYYTRWKAQPRNYTAWSVSNGATAVNAATRYRGYSINGTKFTLNFGLALPGGGEIAVTEVPEYANTGGKTNLVRTLTFAGIPSGYSVSLHLPPGGNWAVTGGGVLQAGNLVQNGNGVTTLTGSW